MEPEPISPAIITPKPDANSFEAGGTVYTATDGLSVARLKIYQRLSLEFATDTGLAAHAQALDEIWAALNEMKLAHAIHKLGGIRDTITGVTGQNRLKGLEICGLFFNAPGEDPGTYAHPAMQAKLAAWGAVHSAFFTCAAIRLAGTLWGSYMNWPETNPSEPETVPTSPLPAA